MAALGLDGFAQRSSMAAGAGAPRIRSAFLFVARILCLCSTERGSETWPRAILDGPATCDAISSKNTALYQSSI